MNVNHILYKHIHTTNIQENIKYILFLRFTFMLKRFDIITTKFIFTLGIVYIETIIINIFHFYLEKSEELRNLVQEYDAKYGAKESNTNNDTVL